MYIVPVVVALLAQVVPAATQPVGDVRRTYSFANDEAPAFAATATGEAEKRNAQPKHAHGQLYLMESWWQSTTSAAFPAPTDQRMRVIDAAWKLVMNTGTEGAGFVWLDVDKHGKEGAAPECKEWEAPNFAGSFGVGFDASNPPNRDPFRGSGNVYDRPQHEVSLHWDGLEIVKRTTPMEFRDEQPHEVKLHIEFVPGGADITLSMDDTAIYERYFIPSMTAYVGGRRSERGMRRRRAMCCSTIW